MNLKRAIWWVGRVDDKAYREITLEIKGLIEKDKKEEMTLVVSSGGGSLSVCMSFYDTVKMLKPNLTTVACGHTHSSAVIIWMAGKRRYVTEHTQVVLHPGRQSADKDSMQSGQEIECNLELLRRQEWSYDNILVQASGNKMSLKDARRLSSKHSVLNPDDLIKWGLAHGIISY